MTGFLRLMVFACLVAFCSLAVSQESPKPLKDGLPVSTQTLLAGVRRPASKGVIKSVLKISCPIDHKKGTGFVLSGIGIVVTNSHVAGPCTAVDLEGVSPVVNSPVKFSKLEQDPNRDLAILCPSSPLPFGLTLGESGDPAVETEVETWGYPLSYEDAAPLLSRGYVAGYRVNVKRSANGTVGAPVKRLIVNGALNPGNSGGPLIDRGTGKVTGIVVEKWRLWSPDIEQVIQGFSHPGVSTTGTFVRTNAQGQQVPISDQEALASTLQEFYDMSQVMVGEAISVSELKAFIDEKKKDHFRCGPQPSN